MRWTQSVDGICTRGWFGGVWGHTPDGPQAKEDALVRAEADGGPRKAPGRRVAGARLDAPLAALPGPGRVHSRLQDNSPQCVMCVP